MLISEKFVSDWCDMKCLKKYSKSSFVMLVFLETLWKCEKPAT